MNLLKAIGQGILSVIKWIAITYSGLCDWIGVSEWAIFFMALGVIASILGIYKLNDHLRNK